MANQLELRAKDEEFIQSLIEHIKQLSRKVLKVDTREEVLNYLAETFIEQLNCDVVAIGLIEDEKLVLHTSGTELIGVERFFPYPVNRIDKVLLESSEMKENNVLPDDSPFRMWLEENEFANWFTMPIADEEEVSGLVLVGFKEETVLYREMADYFDELGNYVAVVLNIIKRNKNKRESMFNLQFLSREFSQDGSLDDLVSKIVTFSGRETNANIAAIYLFNEPKDSLIIQKPTYGYVRRDRVISLSEDNLIATYFPNVEEIGDSSITIPLMSEMNMVGVLYVEKPEGNIFTQYDLEHLEMFGNYFSVTYENLQLIKKEKKQKDNLEDLLNIQNRLIKQTIQSDGFEEINQLLSDALNSSVILYDRFFNLIDYHLHEEDTFTEKDLKQAGADLRSTKSQHLVTYLLELPDTNTFEMMPITDGSTIHAYIAFSPSEDYDIEMLAITINMIKNIYSLQFIKQKISLNAQEQVKDSFVTKLLQPEIDELQEVFEYANLFNWDLYQPYRVAIIDLITPEGEITNLINEKARVNTELEQMREIILNYNHRVIISVIEDRLVLFTPIKEKTSSKYWSKLYKYLSRTLRDNGNEVEFVLGIGGIATSPQEYYDNYLKAMQTTIVLAKDDSNATFAFFEELGSYTVLNWVKDNPVSLVFVRNYLQQLYELSDNQQIDLFDTLRVYLLNNGNMSSTANDLYIHRSTLNYRLDKIKDIITVDIDDANERFNLMLAYKLFSMYDRDVFQK